MEEEEQQWWWEHEEEEYSRMNEVFVVWNKQQPLPRQLISKPAPELMASRSFSRRALSEE